MLLVLRNIGKIEEAKVKLDGITVIAGENNTGKSTVGKALYSVFNSFYRINEQIRKEKVENIRKAIENFVIRSTDFSPFVFDTRHIAEKILINIDKYQNASELLKEDLRNYIDQQDENFGDIEDIDDLIKKINDILNLSNNDIVRTILKNKLNIEFNGQVNNIYLEQEGNIELSIKKRELSISISDNNVEDLTDIFDLNTEVIYIDDPFVLDEYKEPSFRWLYSESINYMGRREHLKSKIFANTNNFNAITEILTTSKLENMFSRINKVCSGEMIKNKMDFVYKEQGTDKLLDIRNMSAGLKTFVIIKTLLQNGSLEENGTIILDEPEIHLHPEWQLIFAELIVLIQKEFGMHILLNTHSPYFLNAIEVYSAKHEIADRCNYYIASLADTGKTSKIIDVTDDIEQIYKKLARPLQDLENERYSND